MTATEYLKNYFGERQEKRKENEPKSYLEPFLKDPWATARMETEIIFDWNTVSDVREVEIDEKWDKSELAKIANRDGKRHMRVLVECPNRKHGFFYAIMSDPPTANDCKCQKCITDEINRVMSARAIRELEYRKRQKKD